MGKPIRILHIVTYMGRGGLETMLMNYYRNIDRTKVQFDFLVHRMEEADYDQEIKSLGGKIYRLPRLNPWSSRYLGTLNQLFKDHPEYQIVHSHLDCMAGIPLKVAKKYGVKNRIAHSHNNSQAKDLKYPLKLYYKRNIPKNATKLFACGQEAGEWMFQRDDFHILNNAIDAKKFRWNPKVSEEYREQLDLKDKFVLGHVGRFAPQKNHDFLIDIFYEVQKKYENSVLLLVGDGELRENIEKKVQDLGIADKVVFLGVRDDVEQLMQAMDVFVFPSLHEGVPLTMVEAQSAGIPCFISDGVPSECMKTNIVKQIPLSENPEVWADEIVKEAGNVKKDTYEQIVAADFDISTNAKWLQEYYESLV